MKEMTASSRQLTYIASTGTFPAWLWQAILNAQRDAHAAGIPVVIAQVGLRTFMILDIDDCNAALSPPEPAENPA